MMNSAKDNNQIKKYDENGQELGIRFGLAGIKAVGIGAMEEIVKNRQQEGKFKDIYDFASRFGTKIINKKSIEALSKAGAFDEIHKNRRQIFDSSDLLIKYSANSEEVKNSNQMNLFSGSISSEKPAMKTVIDWEKKERLQKEFEAFGFFVNQHPLDDFIDDLSKRGIVSSEILNDPIITDGSIIKLAAVVAHSKHRSGPKGRYAYLTLSDPNGIFETSIFNEELITNSRDLMEAGTELVVECNIKKDDGGIRILVRKIERLEDFIKNTKPKKSPYQDIKTVNNKSSFNKEFDWKNKNPKKSEYSNLDPIKSEAIKSKKIKEQEAKNIYSSIIIKINNRAAIFELKSFLSARIALHEQKKFSKIFLETNDKKIELEAHYMIDEEDIKQIKLIDHLDISEIHQ